MVQYKEDNPTYYIRYDNDIPTAKFRLKKLPYCSAIVMLCSLEVFPDHIRLKYTTILCTDVESNTPMRKTLKRCGWGDIHKTTNQNTGNTVYLAIKNLKNMDKRKATIFLTGFFSLVSFVSFLILNIWN